MKETLTDSYRRMLSRIRGIDDEISRTEEELRSLTDSSSVNVTARIEKLREQLEKIDDYVLKVKGFQDLAKRHLDSQNVLSIEAPPGYRVNLNRLRNWAMMIDPMSSNDPYAQRLFVVAKCDEHFLENKRKEFSARIEKLQQGLEDKSDVQRVLLRQRLADLEERRSRVIGSSEMKDFTDSVKAENDRLWHRKAPELFKNPAESKDSIAPGAFAAPLPVDQEQALSVKGTLGDYFDREGRRVLLPVELNNKGEYVMCIRSTPARRKTQDAALQHLLLSSILASPAGKRRLYVMDAVRYNSASLGSLKQLEGSFVLQQIPRNPDQISAQLEQLFSSFVDLDDTLDAFDSLTEYNASVTEDRQLPLTTLVLIGWPSAFGSRDRELVQKIVTNYERYGVSLVTVSYDGEKKDARAESTLPEYALQNAVKVSMDRRETTVSLNDGAAQRFTWYTFQDELSDKFCRSLLLLEPEKKTLGTEYVRRFDLERVPPYVRGRKSISLPYGVDARDQVHSLSFDNENFASYLMGASGSGKSTLLHTLITGILRNYHPDDVELWLADFKMSEFAQYMDPLPPHVKYILLDESPELVYDLLDKLTEEMMERQRFFMKHRDMKKVENVPSSVYMPVIFVILDEFSIMSQAVSESEVYKLRLQNLLAKGRALGIKFIFSSQTFTKGVAGLTQTAKDQIQSRIAMKNSYNEINETLELSSNTRTEQVKNWMDALPPHFALSKYRDGDKINIQRLQVMYFKGKGDEALKPQRRLIQMLRERMHPVSREDYDPNQPDAYVDKHPVVVDGNSYRAFEPEREAERLAQYRAGAEELSPDDLLVSLGSPRRMTNEKYAVVTNESRENLLLVARAAEQSCALAMIRSAAESFRLQGAEIEVWAYGKNRLYRAARESGLISCPVREGMEEICTAIRALKDRIQNRETGCRLIVLLGMEQICGDFGLIDFSAPAARGGVRSGALSPAEAKKLEASTEKEKADAHEVEDLAKRFRAEYHIDELEDEWFDADWSIEEINAEEERLFREFVEKFGMNAAPEAEAKTASEEPAPAEAEPAPEPESPVYNAAEDFKYLVKQGSRFGYHFLLALNTLSDLRATGLQPELFRHKLSFQVSADDSVTLFGNKTASRLPGHICQYSDSLESYSLRPFLHPGLSWDGWETDAEGRAAAPFE